jgi:hypothetical protein
MAAQPVNRLTKKEKQEYDRTITKIRNHFGSYHQIALKCHQHSGTELTGESFRSWFTYRRVPTHIAFLLYEVTDYAIDPITLAPYLRDLVALKRPATSKR